VSGLWRFLNQPLTVFFIKLIVTAGTLTGLGAAAAQVPWLAWWHAVRHWPLVDQILLSTPIIIIVIATVVVVRVRALNRPGPALPVILANFVPLSGPGPWARYRTPYLGAVWHWRVPVIDSGHHPIEHPRNHDFNRLVMDGECPRCPRCESELGEGRSFWGGHVWSCLVCGHRLRRRPSFATAEPRAEKHARGYLTLRNRLRPPTPGAGQSVLPE
jgi:hypothetical protein